MGTGASCDMAGKVNVVTGEGSTEHFKYKHYSIYRDVRLGSGSFGTVYMGFDHDKHRLIAAKQLWFSEEQFSRTEVDVLLTLKEHDHVVRIFDSFIHEDKSFIIMQFCDGPCLDRHMELHNPSVSARMALIFQFIQTIQFMHFSEPRTAHRDLKPANIMVINNGHLKICDFGLAKPVDVDSTQNVSTVAGTYKFLSPEIYQGKRYDPFKADVFSAGLVILGVITFVAGEAFGHRFHTGLGVGLVMSQKGQEGKLEDILSQLDYPCRETMALISLLARMLHVTPAERPDFNEIFTVFICDVKKDLSVRTRGHPIQQQNVPPSVSNEPSSHSASINDNPPKVPAKSDHKPVPPVPSERRRAKTMIETGEKPDLGAEPKIRRSSMPPKLPKTVVKPAPITRVSDPVPESAPSSITPLSHCKLPIKAEWDAGLSSQGDIVVAKKSKIYLYRFSGRKFTKVWTNDLPSEFSSSCNKAANCSELALQSEDGSGNTGFYSLAWFKSERATSLGVGYLLDLWDNGLTACARPRSEEAQDDWVIDVQGKYAERLVTLQPNHGAWGVLLSVCQLADGFAVLDKHSKALTIFDAKGEAVRHRTLNFEPSYPKAVAAVGAGLVAVAEPGAVRLYTTRRTRKVKRYGLEELQVEDACVHSIRVSNQNVLYVTTGDENYITSLHAYKMEFDPE